MINIKDLIIQIKTERTAYTPCLFNHTKRSFLLIERMLRSHKTNAYFTYSAVAKMMSSKRRASKEEILQWIRMLISQNILETIESPQNKRQIEYYQFTSASRALKKEALLQSITIA